MKFADTHEWIKVTDRVGTVGISKHAQKELGEIVYVELPRIGKKVKAGEEAVVLESTKAATDIYSPVSGTITEVNPALSSVPDLVNTSPEKEGWLYKIEMDNLEELDKLMNSSEYYAKFS
ncbi:MULTISPECIES: glycine cleavage system protein GcvH [unclassified Neochlamydia]|uniref:glycine cleavage system protein GcvH n=1 Tax=unclassified Neochlamydia TaxID=2643326 RepID=UPI001BC9E82F|nr:MULTISPECIES: glycine cleavage system protein GcvH [unclassified Neochlamydia]MBS4166240.1 Glycine cleavage system H protein [Neochlamydia sp. AcF65]MBS4170152.1 Glycine cleavage system H protein [Neochlamydia sp. AcF95]